MVKRSKDDGVRLQMIQSDMRLCSIQPEVAEINHQ